MLLVVLTGAGLSAESGLGTFRDKNGLWSRFDPYRLATPEAFAATPDLVHEFYNARRCNLLAAAPNAAHRALARLEEGMEARGDRLVLVTQNVDDLHERAGSREILHMHGELLMARCTACETSRRWTGDLSRGDACPACGATDRMRPDVVWFGEVPKHQGAIRRALEEADLFAAIGTSGTVEPAASFVQWAAEAGARTVEINLEPTGSTALFDAAIQGPATVVVPAWVGQVLA